MHDVEGEEVMRQGERNRQLTQINTGFWERDCPGRCGARLAPRCGGKDGDVFGGTPNTAVETTALPTARISVHPRLFASIRGSRRKSLISRIGLTQVVDFHDFSGYFFSVQDRLGSRSSRELFPRSRGVGFVGVSPYRRRSGCKKSHLKVLYRFLLHPIAPYRSLFFPARVSQHDCSPQKITN
jgi:hypothetical protein